MNDAAPRKIALVTGASRGLGAALAQALAPTHHIVAVARTTGALEELDDRIKAQDGDATLAPMDINTEAAMAQLCRSIYDRWGALDLWVHTAVHAAPMTPTHQIDAKDWRNSLNTNVDAVARLIGFISPLLGETGRAVFFDDPRAGQKFFGSYGATKAAQIALARSWQAETVRLGPKVQVIDPGPVATHTRARFFPGEDRTALPAATDVARTLLPDLL